MHSIIVLLAPAASKFRNISQNLDVSVNLGENGLYLPMGNHINKNLQKRIVNTFRKVIS